MAAVRQRRPLQVFRVASLVLPSAIACEVASMSLHRSSLDEALGYTLVPMWLATVGGLVVRGVDAAVRRRTRPHGPAWFDAIDVLTASGSSMAWTGAGAVLLAVSFGWASLSLVGLFGLCAPHLVALWTLLRAGGDDPWRAASLTRSFTPSTLVEGQPVTEELRLVAPRIPAGFRLFASGRVGPRWPVSRYAVEASDSGGEIVLESDVGPALRGSFDAEPLEVWLQDVLGLCHSPRIRAGAAPLTVLPAAAAVDCTAELVSSGGHDAVTRAAQRLPTEGSMALREYQPGDDVRRIHWMRSLTAREIVVRLPDELPPDQPAVQLVLDTFHPHLVDPPTPLTCRGPDDLLDGLVRVWLGVGRALVERGMRVMAVVPGEGGERAGARVRLSLRAMPRALQAGARAGWQATTRPADLLGRDATIFVSHRLPADDVEATARWIVLPTALWTSKPDPYWSGGALLRHPVGSADNRRSRRKAQQAARLQERTDHDTFRWLCEHTQARREGNLVAEPTGPLAVRLQVLR
jgi:uncharacterized protein (DUF58 family)